jgi:hypothetical protein
MADTADRDQFDHWYATDHLPAPTMPANSPTSLATTRGKKRKFASRPTVTRHCRSSATCAPYKRVRRLEFADLPKTISCKIRRVELCTAEAARHQANPGRAAGEFWEEDFPELR